VDSLFGCLGGDLEVGHARAQIMDALVAMASAASASGRYRHGRQSFAGASRHQAQMWQSVLGSPTSVQIRRISINSNDHAPTVNDDELVMQSSDTQICSRIARVAILRARWDAATNVSMRTNWAASQPRQGTEDRTHAACISSAQQDHGTPIAQRHTWRGGNMVNKSKSTGVGARVSRSSLRNCCKYP
jgi:hypothetical protein